MESESDVAKGMAELMAKAPMGEVAPGAKNPNGSYQPPPNALDATSFVATRAASFAFKAACDKAKLENRGITPEELAACEAAGFAAYEAEQKESTAATGEVDQESDLALIHAYFCACCNVQRGVEDLPVQLAKEAAATLRVHTVDFETWKRRLGYGQNGNATTPAN